MKFFRRYSVLWPISMVFLFLAYVLTLSLVVSPPRPAKSEEAAKGGWAIADMNRAIEQTNFIVGGGCSGTLISVAEKLVLTNYHCVDKQVTAVEREVTNQEGWVKKVRVRIYADVPVAQNRYDGFVKTGAASYVSEIAAESKTRDLALLRLKGPIPHSYASPLLPVDGVVRRGDQIYSVGNPAGEDATLGSGIVSNVNRTFDFPWTDGAKLAMIQFSGGLFGGNSGGALYNTKGEIIGVPAAGYRDATFIGFAVPVSVVRAFLKDNCFTADLATVTDDAACREAKRKAQSKEEGKGD